MVPRKTKMLTPRQQEIYDLLHDKIINSGSGPTVREIGAHFGIRSPNGVMCHLKALEKKGLITRESHMSRAIQLADRPERSTSLKQVGEISATKSVLKDGDPVDFSSVLAKGHSCFRAKDDSLSGNNIGKGDYVIVREQQSYRDSDVVVALDGKKASIKKHKQVSKLDVMGVLAGVIRKS